MSVLSYIPWWLKITGKIFLSRIPLGYSIWSRLKLFKKGDMLNVSYAYSVFRLHYDKVDFPEKDKGFTQMEIGPGDSLASGVFGYAHGAALTWLIDTGHYASNSPGFYRQLQRCLDENNCSLDLILPCNEPEKILRMCHIKYMTTGMQALQSIEDNSVHFIWSQAVLEHIRKSEFIPFFMELRRIIHKKGVCSHRVDLMDHLGGGLNNLRFPDKLWESDFMAESGFYTNRIRYSDMLQLFSECGFNCEVQNINRWKELPIKRSKLSKEFADLSDDELRISSFDVILSPV